MATLLAPQIVTNGLVFYYDMNNVQKSWKGEPTVNYVPNPYASHNGSSIVLGYNYANNGATYTYRTNVDNPINSPGVLEYYTGNTDYKYFSIDTSTVPTTGTYTFSYYARIANGATSSSFSNAQLWRANGSDRAVTGDWNPTITTAWKRFSTSGPIEANTILQYFPMHSGALTGGITVHYCGFQCELKSQSTPFVAGTRSSTQAIVDPIGSNTITASSLTYNSDGTFGFNGSSNYIAITNSSSLRPSTELTIECVIRPTSTPASWSQLIGYGQADYTNGNYLLFLETASTVCRALARVNNTEYRCNTNYTAPVNSYTFVTFTMKTGDAIRSYFNGVADVTASLPAGTFTYNGTTSAYQIGSPGGSWFPGQIPMMKIYNRALTATEVQQNFNAHRMRYGL